MTNLSCILPPASRSLIMCSPDQKLSPSMVAVLCIVLILSGCVGAQSARSPEVSTAQPLPALKHAPTSRSTSQLLPGDRIVFGTAKAISGNQIKVEYADSLQPRYLPLSVAEAKGMELKPGDSVMMVFNEQQVLVDFHPWGHKDSHHTVMAGHVAEQMKVGQERVVVRADDGETTTHPVSPLIRSKLASMPIGAPAVFLVDETDHIVDVTFGDSVSLEHMKHEYRQISNPKAPHDRINGTVVEVMADGHIMIKTTDGEQQVYSVRPYAAKELALVQAGDAITLLIDSSQQVLDIARLNKR